VTPEYADAVGFRVIKCGKTTKAGWEVFLETIHTHQPKGQCSAPFDLWPRMTKSGTVTHMGRGVLLWTTYTSQPMGVGPSTCNFCGSHNICQHGRIQSNQILQGDQTRWGLLFTGSTTTWPQRVGFIGLTNFVTPLLISILLLYSRFLVAFHSVSILLCPLLLIWVQISHHHLPNHGALEFFSSLLLVYLSFNLQ